MSKIRNGGLDQYGAEPFEQQHFGTAGVGGVKSHSCYVVDKDIKVRIDVSYLARTCYFSTTIIRFIY